MTSKIPDILRILYNSESLSRVYLMMSATNDIQHPKLPSSVQRERRIKKLQDLSTWMDSRFRIPGTNITFGLDFFIGLVPLYGEVITTIISAYLIFEVARINGKWSLLWRMVLNVFIDYLIGLIPVIGDFADIGFRANLRNVRLMMDNEEQERNKTSVLTYLLLVLIFLLLLLVVVILPIILITYLL